ncbi:MAG TPA: RnfABCDGE type electron transport complex subunit G [Candidatus Alistipes excrementipullorum]|nr:RnfABCDGE type electron transport complex subunit G [Candidatus Alistipes excrementipullorum]
MVTVLFCITLVASAGVGAVNMITAEPIAASKQKAVEDAILAVLPAFEQSTAEEMTIDEMPITVHKAVNGNDLVGYAVETMTKSGFNGVIRLMVGFSPEGQVLNVNVLEQAETPGLGTKMCDEGNPLISSIKGKNLESMKLVDGRLAVRKDGGDVDALTAATISSRAYVDAVNRAYMAYKSVVDGTEPTDVSTGATKTQKGGNNE